jgi:hypothetical protein
MFWQRQEDKTLLPGAVEGSKVVHPWRNATIALGAIVAAAGVGIWAVSELQDLKLSDLKFADLMPDFDQTDSKLAAPPAQTSDKPAVTTETPKQVPPPQPSPEPPPTPIPKPEVPVVEKPRFVSADTYQQSELNLGGVDTNCDGCLDGHFTRLSETPIEYPSDTQTTTLQERLSREEGVELSDRECAEAIRAGGFEKDGKTYELWVSKNDPNVIEIVPVNAGHELVGDVPKFDQAPDAPEISLEQVQEDADRTFGWKDRCGNVVPGSGEAGLKMRLEYVGLENASDYRYGPNPFDPRDPRYTVWQEIHMFMNRNRI